MLVQQIIRTLYQPIYNYVTILYHLFYNNNNNNNNNNSALNVIVV